MAAVVGSAVVVAAVAVASVTSGPATAPQGAPVAADRGPLPTPLATSVLTAAGPWATVAMGRLSDPAGTFWQLLHQPAGGGRWTDDVEVTAVATNGGLELAGAPTATPAAGDAQTAPPAGAPVSRLLVGVVPSELLRFSPLLETTDGGTSWHNGVLGVGLAAHPSALALGPGSEAAAITVGPPVAVRTSPNGTSNWRRSATLAGLRSMAMARRCGLQALTAVGFLGHRLVVGGACRHGAQLGLFVADGPAGGGWRAALSSPAPGLGTASSPVGASTVLALWPTTDGLTAVVAEQDGDHLDLATATVADAEPAANRADDAGDVPARPGPRWRLPRGASLVSVVGDAEGDVLALAASDGRLLLARATPGASRWQPLPAPPAGTATVIGTEPMQALDVDGRQLTVLALTGADGQLAWRATQRLTVAVPTKASEGS